MEKFVAFRGLVAPIDKENIDTDAIIPKQFMKSIRRTGFGANLFDAWRYEDPGEPGKAAADRVPRPDFVLNQQRYQGASILITGANFGCGSSREHAPWALRQFGFRVLIAPSFGEIFLSNAFKNGLLPVALDATTIRKSFEDIAVSPGYSLNIDLMGQSIGFPDGTSRVFAIDPFRKQCLLDGADEIQLTLRHADKITAFEAARLSKQPWLSNTLP